MPRKLERQLVDEFIAGAQVGVVGWGGSTAVGTFEPLSGLAYIRCVCGWGTCSWMSSSPAPRWVSWGGVALQLWAHLSL